MSDVYGSLATNIRALSRLSTNLIEICHECRSNVTPTNKEFDIDSIKAQLRKLRDVLEDLRDAATTPTGSASLAFKRTLGSSDQVINELLSRCRKDMSRLGAELKQKSGGENARGPPSSTGLNLEGILGDLALSTAAMKDLIARDRIPFGRNDDSRPSVPSYTDSRFSNTLNVHGDQSIHYHITASNNAGWVNADKLRAWLSAPDPNSNYNDTAKKRGPGTGVWFINSTQFRKWKTASYSFLWVYGIPGCGKSVLCSTVIESVAKHCQEFPSCALAYFYFDFNEPSKRQSANLLRSFLTQLSSRAPKCLDILNKCFARCADGKEQPTNAILLAALEDMVRCFEHVFFAIDALDECSDQDDLLSFLTEISNWKLRNLHVIATSRKDRWIEDGLNDLVSVQLGLDTDLVDVDIRSHIRAQLASHPRFKKWTTKERQEIEDSLMQRANGMFRWATCQLEVLAKCSSLNKLRKALRSLPKSLEETYDRILVSIDEEQRDDALKLLQWLAFSARPLALAEMAEVFAIDRSEHIPRFDPDQRPREPRDLVEVCSSLIAISCTIPSKQSDNHSDRPPDSLYETGTLSLAHLSVKEYLLSEHLRRSSMSSYHLNKKLADTVMSRECLAYLLQFNTVDCLKHCTESSISFGRYAAEFWVVHARSDDGVIQSDVQPIITALFSSGRALIDNWITLFDVDQGHIREPPGSLFYSPICHPLYYASRLGLDHIVDQLISNGDPTDVNLVGGLYGIALAAACAGDHKAIVESLLKIGANVDLAEGRALVEASAGGHEAIVRFLLENGADINLGGWQGNALAHASLNGHEAIVRLLLENGANINLGGERGRSALPSASLNGHEAIVRLLLESGADINLKGGDHGNALASASLNGHEAIVRLLLGNGADINLEGGPYGGALASASARGHEDIVQLLLENGADINLIRKIQICKRKQHLDRLGTPR